MNTPCRVCGQPLENTVVDLGVSPLCESYVEVAHAADMEPFYPLKVEVCEHCLMVQVGHYVRPEEIFTEYAYFSSYSDSWLRHAALYVEMAIQRFGLGTDSFVVELASNDGYLLRNFVSRGIPCLGVEPAANVVQAALEVGVPSRVDFFGPEVAWNIAEEQQADLIVANNVLAHVPDINGFVDGIRILLKPDGVATLEFPHLMKLIEQCQYDTIYHEHFSYISLLAAQRLFSAHGMRIFDVEELATHGGSLRIFVGHENSTVCVETQRLRDLELREHSAGYTGMAVYSDFGERVWESKRTLLTLLIAVKRAGKSVAGYGASGKGNTLLNYCGIGTDFIDYTVDRNPYKHGRLLPGSRIPVFPVSKIRESRPDYLLIFPWNLKEEIMENMAYVRSWECRFIVPIPEAVIIE